MKFRYKDCSQRKSFPLPCCPRAGMEGLIDTRTPISSENIQLLQSYITTYRKKLEEVVFVAEEFLQKKISEKDVYKSKRLSRTMMLGEKSMYDGKLW